MFDPRDPTSAAFRDTITAELDRFLDAKAVQLAATARELTSMVDVARSFISQGKRLRPAFGYWGYAGFADDVPDELLTAVASLELLHIGVLMHDDVLDDADTRRGLPAAHRQFEARHRDSDGAGDALEYGRALAIVLGDQLLVWSVELGEQADLERWGQARRYLDLVRTEVNSGQVLDLQAQYGMADQELTAEQIAQRVLEEKTSRYTVQRPLQFGAAAAGASSADIDALGRYGLALGRAFQLRDDLLGIYGSSAETGKPEAGDLREGKRTVLVARALANASRADRERFTNMLGDPGLDEASITWARQFLRATGATDDVERMITHDYEQALAALNDATLTDHARQALTTLADQCVRRDT